MITVLHGDNTSAITKRTSEIEKEYKSILRLDCKKDAFENILHSTLSSELFSENKLVIVTHYNTFIKKPNGEFAEWIKKNKDFIADLLIISDVSLKNPSLPGTDAKFEEFSLPKFFFLFLDSVSPGNTRQALDYYNKALGSLDEIQVFYALVKRVRQLILVKSEQDASRIMSAENLQGWQIGKLRSQAMKWRLEELFLTYQKLYQTEKDMKTGGDILKVGSRLDIIIGSALN